MKNKKSGFDYGSLAIIIALLSCLGITPLLYNVISFNGLYPSGSDTMYHIFRGDMLYKAISRGEGYPLYDRYWYNGFEPMRYWPPLSPIVYAIFQFAAGGQVFKAYIYYCCAVFVGGVFSWLYIGLKKGRPVLGVFLGIIWFFLPNNLHAMFNEGNLPRSLSMIFLPIAVYSVYNYLDSGRAMDLFRLIVSFVLLILCHLGYAAMVALAMIGYLLVQRLYTKNGLRMLKVVFAILIAFLITGLYMIPSLFGGISTTNADTVRNFFQSILVTLNPFYRIKYNSDTFYFGLSAFVIAIFGTLVSNKKAAPGFLNAIIIVLLTTNTAYSIIQVVPGSNLMWMLRFLSIALCMVFLSLMYWEKLRKWILVVFIILLCVDTVPSLKLFIGYQSGVRPETRLSKLADETYVTNAQEMCVQRIALFDLSSLGATGAYIISDFGNPQMAVFGAGWEAAVTADNITRLNRAMNDEYFDYMFDRCIDLGADTIIIQKDQAVYGERTLVKLDAAAARSGYDIIYENDDYMLYKLPVDSTFGTFTVYDAIAIGESAYTLAFAFPNIQETTDAYIDHYSFDILKKYKTVYLSGFYYEDKAKAEKLVTDLSENGVRIVILADGMPEDRSTRTKNFLGVTCNIIQFENGYPILYTEDYGEMDCDLFPRGYSKWITCYLNGLKDAKGTIFDNDVELAFYGTGINENVCYLSLNLPFYYYLTHDLNAEKIIQWIMGMDPGQLPEKHIYPIEINYSSNGITIHNYVDLILKTGVAFHDNFRSGQKIYSDNHILAVGEGDTKISFVYPYLWQGLLTSLTGILLTVLFLVYVAKAYRRDEYLRERGLYGAVHIGILDTFRGTGIEKINKAPAVDTTEKTSEEISLSEEPQIEVHASDSEGLSDEIIEAGATEDNIPVATEDNIPVATEDNIPVTTEDNKSVTTEDNRSIASEDNRTEPKIINDIKYEVESGNIEEVISDSYAELELNQKKDKIPDSMRNVENLWEFDMPLINGDDFDIVKTKENGRVNKETEIK